MARPMPPPRRAAGRDVLLAALCAADDRVLPGGTERDIATAGVLSQARTRAGTKARRRCGAGLASCALHPPSERAEPGQPGTGKWQDARCMPEAAVRYNGNVTVRQRSQARSNGKCRFLRVSPNSREDEDRNMEHLPTPLPEWIRCPLSRASYANTQGVPGASGESIQLLLKQKCSV